MEDLYKHIESLGKEHGYKNMTVLCKGRWGSPLHNVGIK